MRKKIQISLMLGLFIIVLVNSATAAVYNLDPNGDGFYTAWTANGCAADYQCVDEVGIDTSDNLSSTLFPNSATFTLTDMLTNVTINNINSVTLWYRAQWASSTYYKFKPLLRISNANYWGSVISTTSSWESYSQTFTNNPATGLPWTVTEVNNLEAGMTATSASNAGGRVATFDVVVDYN